MAFFHLKGGLQSSFQGGTAGKPVSVKALTFMDFFSCFLSLFPVLFWLKLVLREEALSLRCSLVLLG